MWIINWQSTSMLLLGPQQQTGFGATPFGAPVSSTPSLFGQPDASKPGFGQNTAFGQTSSTFGQTTGFGLATQQQTSLFGKPTGDYYIYGYTCLQENINICFNE